MTRKIVNISDISRQAKYRQIINSILDSIAGGRLKRGDKIPSINSISQEFGLSRDTVMLAFNELKARGIIVSAPGIGYFVESTNVTRDLKVFLLFDEFNTFKENIYNAFMERLEGKAQVDIFFHHFNKRVFESLIKENASRYTTFVILPGNITNVEQVLSRLPQDKIIILDQIPDDIEGKYPAIYQDFEEEVYQGLMSGLTLLKKYKKFVMVFPGGKEPLGFLNGFRKFCDDYHFEYEIISDLVERNISKGEVYLLPNDRDLVNVVKIARENKLILSKDLGIISINDTPLKEVVADGITTLSADFYEMGKLLADMIIHQERGVIKNKSKLIIRNSL